MKPIPNLPGYFACEQGLIWSSRNSRSLRVVKAFPDADGYLRLRLRNDGKYLPEKVHRLIAKTFLGPKPEGQEIRHLNGIRSDNRPQNLRYGTKAENKRDSIEHGTVAKGSKNGRSKVTETDVATIRCRAKQGETYRRIAKDYSLDETVVSRMCRKITWRHV